MKSMNVYEVTRTIEECLPDVLNREYVPVHIMVDDGLYEAKGVHIVRDDHGYYVVITANSREERPKT